MDGGPSQDAYMGIVIHVQLTEHLCMLARTQMIKTCPKKTDAID